MNKAIYVTHGTDGRAMARELMEAADVKARLSPGMAALLKPNLVLPSPADEGATTHPEIVRGVIEYLREHGVRDIAILESAWVGASTREAFRVCGYEGLSKALGVPLLDAKREPCAQIDAGGMKLKVIKAALEAELLINLPVLKGHCQTRMTCALKNLKGLIPDDEKRRYHRLGLHEPIARLAAAVRPHLTIVDSLCGDLDFEEGGTPVDTRRMLLGYDPVKLDAYCLSLMGLQMEDVPYIALAERYGAGSARYTQDEIITLTQANGESGLFEATTQGDDTGRPGPASAYGTAGNIQGAQAAQAAGSPPGEDKRPVSGRLRSLTARVREDGACSACYASLVRALYQLEQGAGRGKSASSPEIAIGQGYRGQAPDALGVGKCCALARRGCVAGCPPSASEILKFL